jgi:DNA-directed RNA polymerase specialized sigma24 family protein
MTCYRATVAEVFRYASMLCGSDRARAEDLVQDAFLGLVRRVRAGERIDVSVGYLMVAVRHRFLDDVKQRAREQRRIELVASSGPSESPGPIVELAGLSERERTAMVLRFVDDLSVAAVADAMGISTRAAESLLARATRRLRSGGVNHA